MPDYDNPLSFDYISPMECERLGLLNTEAAYDALCNAKMGAGNYSICRGIDKAFDLLTRAKMWRKRAKPVLPDEVKPCPDCGGELSPLPGMCETFCVACKVNESKELEHA